MTIINSFLNYYNSLCASNRCTQPVLPNEFPNFLGFANPSNWRIKGFSWNKFPNTDFSNFNYTPNYTYSNLTIQNPFNYQCDYNSNIDTFEKTLTNYNNFNITGISTPITPSWGNYNFYDNSFNNTQSYSIGNFGLNKTYNYKNNNSSNTPKTDSVQTVSMSSLDLKGTIASCNSNPSIAKQNVEKLQQLDSILNKWGYDVTYTSAMGGNHATGSGHYKGNKVDIQLAQNGKSAHLTNEQLTYLKKEGYWGTGTGALGWEAHQEQTGGGHYDLYIA